MKRSGIMGIVIAKTTQIFIWSAEVPISEKNVKNILLCSNRRTLLLLERYRSGIVNIRIIFSFHHHNRA